MSGNIFSKTATQRRHSVNWSRLGGPVTISVIFVVLFVFQQVLSPGSFSYFDFNSISNGGATLALASIGQTIIILTRGFDLSAGAAISLVNVVVASIPQTTILGQVGAVVAGLAVGTAIGAFNGFFVAVLRLQSIVVTLATMFLVSGITLLIMPSPGGSVGIELSMFFAGSAIPEVLPSSVLVILVALTVWYFIRSSKFGVSLYAVGSDLESAKAIGLPVQRTRFLAFTLGGTFYGAAGVFISAQTGAADPLIGNPILLQTFAAVVLGGTALAGGRGGAFGSVVGAYTLMLLVNILLVLDVSAYYSTVVEAGALLFAASAGLLGASGPLRSSLDQIGRGLNARRLQVIQTLTAPDTPTPLEEKTGNNWLNSRRIEFLKMVLPAYAFFVLVLIAIQLIYGGDTIWSLRFYNSLVPLVSFLAILALGQGAVVLSGGLDLSIPWTIAFCGIVGADLMHGSDQMAVWVIPMVLAIGAGIGMLNGIGVAAVGLPPIVMTLAMNGLLQGAALVYSEGTPSGISAPVLRWLMTGKLWGISPMILFMAIFVTLALILLTRTTFGRRVVAVGYNPRAAFLSGVNVGGTRVLVYMLSGVCSAIVGLLLTGFGGQASLGMGDIYLLPSLAVIIIGGTAITGGRGHYAGMLGGALLLTALQTLLAGTTLPFAFRDIIFGLVVLGAILSLREKH
jgi:ribose transport system permease protein